MTAPARWRGGSSLGEYWVSTQVGFKWTMVNQRVGEDYEWLLPLANQSGIKLLFHERSDLLKRAVSKVQNKKKARTEKQSSRLSHKIDMPAGDELIKLLDDERAVLDELRGLWHRATDYGVLTRRVDADNAVLDDMRRWILGDLATEARCAPEAKAPSPPSFAQVHTGSIADHVSNWGDVRDTLRGTRYEKYLPQPIDPIIDPSNPRLPL